jgi:DNA-binding response OmpR family regulator
MDGIDAAREMRDRLGLPVVFLTAHAEGATLLRAKKVEPFGYVLKPFEDRELKIVIEMALYKHGAQNELKQKYAEIERFNQLAVSRELRMIELKQEINELLQVAGKPPKYKVVDEP